MLLVTFVTGAAACAHAGPSARIDASAIVNPVNGRLIVFGGRVNSSGAPTNEIWALPLAGPPIWTRLLPGNSLLARAGHSAIHDPVRHRMIVFGGSTLDEVWALELSGSLAWSRIVTTGPSPGARSYTSAIYDPVRDRMIVFGGESQNDVWALTLSGTPTWSLIQPPGQLPSGRYAHSAIYDPVRDRMVISGGLGGSDTWALPLDGISPWTRIEAQGSSPFPRHGHAAVYDSAADRMVLFGGYTSNCSNESWSLPLHGDPIWTKITSATTLPHERNRFAATGDPTRSRLIVFGGTGCAGWLGDTWVLPLQEPLSWSMIQPSDVPPPPVPAPVFLDDIAGIPSSIPLGRSFTLSAVVRNDGTDSDDGRIVVGFPTLTDPADGASVSSPSQGDQPGFRLHAPGSVIEGAACEPITSSYLVAEYADNAWAAYGGETQRFDLTVTPRVAGKFYVDVRSTMRVAGTYSCEAANALPANGDTITYVDQQGWAVRRFAVTVVAPPAPGEPPIRRRLHSAVHDPVRNRMLVFGGWVGVPSDETWELSLGPSPTWSQVVTGAGPSPRYAHASIYDPVRDRMIVFGGYDDARRNDVWALSLADPPTWTRIEPQGAVPAARRYHSAAYDALRDRLVIYAGTSDSGDMDDVWALDLSGEPRWANISYWTPRPPWRKQSAIAYDPVRDQLVVFGGAAGGSTLHDDLWSLPLAGSAPWRKLGPFPEPGPRARSGHTLTYDAVRDLLWLVGGYSGGYENDVWTFSPGSGLWEKAATWGSPMPGRELHTTVADPAADRLVVYGGSDSLGRVGDTWFLSRPDPSTWQELGADPPGPPPPDPAPVFAAAISGLPASITIGQSFQVTVSVRNDGFPSDDGRISLSFPSFTDPSDSMWVSAPRGADHPGLIESPAGATILSSHCQPMTASRLVVEYADSSWQGFGGETNTVTFTVQPRAIGAFHLDLRATLHRAGASGCEVVSAVPDTGEGGHVDPQGWPVMRFTVNVQPPLTAARPVFTWPSPDAQLGRIVLGETFTMHLSVQNDGATSDDGRIVLGFPALTEVGDSALVRGQPLTGPGYRELVAGSTLSDSTCTPMAASYLTAEYVDNDWKANGAERREIVVTVTPREPGRFYVYVRSTMRTAGLGACAYVNGLPTGGKADTDQQGWTVKRYGVTVDPPPTVAEPAFTAPVYLSTSTVVIGQRLEINIEATNHGAASDDGRVVVGFPTLTDSADVEIVTVYGFGGGNQHRTLPAGSTVADSLCGTLAAGYLVVEGRDFDWQWLGRETHRLGMSVRPRALGTFHVDVRATMRTAGAGACAWVNGVPENGDTLVVDQQGWLVRRFTITVVEEPPPDPAIVILGVAPTPSIILGQTLAITSTVVNHGWTSDDGRFCVSFPSFSAPSDSARVRLAAAPTTPSVPGYREFPAGDLIERSDCEGIVASHLLIEYRDNQWAGSGSESHAMILHVTPRDTGSFVIRVRSTMHWAARGPCDYVNGVPTGGTAGTDQQGWEVREFAVRVDPPPPTAPVFVTAIGGIPTAISLGETFVISTAVRNNGSESDDGRVSFAFPTLTDPGDASRVAITGATDVPGLVARPAGSTLTTANCQSVEAGYLVAEYVDDAWGLGETNTVSLIVQPGVEGAFFVDVRATMHDPFVATGTCSYPTGLPPNGVPVLTDPQGFPVRRFTVQVGPPPGPPSVQWWPIDAGTSGPSARSGAVAVYNSLRQSLVLYGGTDPTYRTDTWSLPLSTPGASWTQVTAGGPAPLRRTMHSMVYNQRDDQVVIFGGLYIQYLNDMEVLAMSGTPWWFLNPGHGAPPSPRGSHAAVYDTRRHRMLVIGGYGGALLNDVWEYAPPGVGLWRQVSVAGVPMPPRAEHAAVYDPVRDRVVVIGGDGGVFLNDVWALNLTEPPTWEQLQPGGALPSARRQHSAIYDPVADRVVVYGGFDGARCGDLWALSLGGAPSWSRLTSSTLSPASRTGHTAVYDAPRHRMVMFGGSLGTNQLSREVWALNLDDPTPVAMSLVSAETQADRVRLVWAGKGLASIRTELERTTGEEETWESLGTPVLDGDERLVFEDRAVQPGRRYGYRLLAWDGQEETVLGPVWVTVPERATLELTGARPNPASGELRVAFALGSDRSARLELFDLGGRRVAEREVGSLGPGRHIVALGGRADLSAGVYLLRLTQDAQVLHAKACIVR